ncbi:MAG: UDP-N-acetylmuramoyl-tripeptide--D-alanyl-D-alanine ligase [Lachnospiraceae bacterium]|nr:UDP-N-acetylmuramoyl-tripeptide--D-alanyl-D-alanine ligase [Lachnospiraceae bacterium]
MKNMTPMAIAGAVGGRLIGAEHLPEAEITGVTIDSRKVTKGCLFVALPGERVDGHRFILQAIRDGAMLALAEREPEVPCPCILVESTRTALRDLAEYYLNQVNIPVVGITGSVGKTSTKEMIAAVLAKQFRVLKTEGNFNNEIGLPLTVFGIRPEHEIAVLEMGISDFGEMSRLARIARPDVCVITNIGTCHLENLGDRDGVFRAKTEVFSYMKEGGIAVLNGDDDKLRQVEAVKGRSPVFFGLQAANAAVTAEEIVSHGLYGTDFTLKIQNPVPCLKAAAGEAETFGEPETSGGGDRKPSAGEAGIRVHLSIPGAHMITDALAAAAVGLVFGIPPQKIVLGLEQARQVGGRQRMIQAETRTVIDDCYNANPMSMAAALQLLAQSTENQRTRRVAILGDMFELGADEKKLHYDTGVCAAACEIELLIFVGELAAWMKRGAEAERENRPAGEPEHQIIYYPTVDEALLSMESLLKPGDLILVKASHGMAFDRIVGKLTGERG